MFSHILTVVKYMTYKVKHLDIKLSALALVTGPLVEKVLPEFRENVFNTAKKDYFNNVVEAWLILANQGIKEDKDLIKVVVALIKSKIL